MKKVVSILVVAVILMSFVAEKFIVIRMKEDQINFHWQGLNNTKQLVNKSSLPHDQVVYILQSIDSLQKDIQLNASIDSTELTKPPVKK